jgi:hypothetical protein
LIGLRGDLDPLSVVASTDFELSDQTPFYTNSNKTEEKKAAEWRSTYRARRDVMVEGTAIRAGESLLLDRPTAAGLRACASMVRAQAGPRLLGICLFRIPTLGDATTLTLAEIQSALGDGDPRFSLEARLDQFPVDETHTDNIAAVLELKNSGVAASRVGDGALTVLVSLPPGSLESVTVNHSASAEPVFESGGAAVRCAVRRANAVKLSVSWWPPGAKLIARFETTGASSNAIGLRYAATLDDGSVVEGSKTLTMSGTR